MTWQDDPEFTTYTITGLTRQRGADIDGLLLELNRGDATLMVAKPSTFTIVKGQQLRLYGVTAQSSTIRGIVVIPSTGLDHAHTVFYRTPDEQAVHAAERREQLWAEKRARFVTEQAELDAIYIALPDVFQRRLDRFRRGQPDFRWKYESFEARVCQQAVIIAEFFRAQVFALEVAPVRTVEDPAEKALQWFAQLPIELQRRTIPTLGSDNTPHSIGMSLQLAYHYLTKPTNVITEHGSATPQIPCEEYGCTHDVPLIAL